MCCVFVNRKLDVEIGDSDMQIFRRGLGSYLTALSCLTICFFCTIIFAPIASAECYTYDDLGRLITVVYDNDGANGDNAKRQYNLDKHGNRKTVEDAIVGGGVCAQPSGSTTLGASGAADVDYGASANAGAEPLSNVPPIANDDIIAVEVNASITVTPLDDDTDANSADGLVLTGFVNNNASLISVSQSGNSIFVTAGSSAGTATITYTISDGKGGTDIGLITVTVTASGGAGSDPCLIDPNLPGCVGAGGN